MKVARKYQILLAAFSAILAVAVACSKNSVVEEQNPQGGDEVSPKGVPVSLAFGMKDAKYSPATKTLADVAQTNDVADNLKFRGMSDIWFLPFDVQREIRAEDSRLGDYLTLPYAGIDKTFGDDASSGSFRGLVNTNNSHYYKNIYVPSGTASFLVYGKAAEVNGRTIAGKTYTSGTQEYKHLYGSLIASDETSGGTAGVKASDITFSPEAIVEDDATKTAILNKAQRVADILNDVLNSTYTITCTRRQEGTGANRNRYRYYEISETKQWTSSTASDKMNNLYNSLTQDSVSGAMISGSGLSVTHILKNLDSVLNESDNFDGSIYGQISGYDSYSDDPNGSWSNNTGTRLTVNEYYNRFRAQIRNKIASYFTTTPTSSSAVLNNANADLRDFPTGDGLPEGCVALKWNTSTNLFEVVSEGSYDIHLAPMDRFCYPPSLWYFVNSQVSVAKKLNSEDTDAAAERNIAAYYKTSTGAWSNILSQYNTGERRLGPVVKKGAVSVAINDPMQYGVALLELKLSKTGSATLDDASNPAIHVDVNNSNFPMTAVIIAGQHKQSFNFTPQSGNEYYVYDNMPLSNTGETLAWITNSGSVTNSPSYSLLLQSLQAEDVIICVEFQNNSTTTFKGATGYIVPGSKFYMLGEIKYNSASSGDKTVVKSVFQQDYITKVTLTINNLKKAFNCIPDLQDPQLEVGVEIDVDWILSTPTEVPLF